jgi:general secretion pathway protein D
MMIPNFVVVSTRLVVVSMLVSACTSQPVTPKESQRADLGPRGPASAPRMATAPEAPAPADVAAPVAHANDVQIGTGVTFRAAGPTAARVAAPGGTQPVSLSFENGDIREVVRNILGDLLGENFIIDPRVQGTITMKTAKPVPVSDVIVLLETILRSNNVGLVRDGAYWRVLPLAEAVKGVARPVSAATGITTIRGASVVIYPVKQIGAKEMQRILEPFARDAQSLRVDELRNLLFISGPQTEIERLVEIADMFDVNLLAGMSFAMIRLQSADVKLVMADYERIVGGPANPFSGLLRVIPIERMNAILLISPQRDVIVDARQWLERLDNGSDTGGGARLYVYNVQYSQAEKLQATLQQALSGRANPAPAATVAPGQTANTLTAPVAPIAGQALITPGNTLNNPQPSSTTRPVTPTIGAANQSVGLARNAVVIADKDRNALLIVATPAEYSAIEAAIKKLDTPPKMIAIEVQIAQVALDGAFQFGISGMFTGKPESAANRLTSEGGVGTLNPLVNDKIVPGFNYTWQGAAAKAILSTLQTTGQSRTLASPTLMTLENQKVSFSNGTQISVQTQTTVSSPTTSAQNSYQYIPTGLTINITPRVSGNNVFLEIQQENSTAGAVRPGSDNPNPDITKNSQQSTVMVANGDTMLLSGLFVENGGRGTSGFPVLSTIPLLGGLFGSQSFNSNRSELVMLVTPRVMSTVEESRGVVDELRQRMSGIESLIPAASTRQLPTNGELRKAAEAAARPPAPSLGGIDGSLRVSP